MSTTNGPSPGGQEMGSDARPHSVFPLPLLQAEAKRLGLSRRCAQRQGRRINHVRDANETIVALNWMAGASTVGDVFRPSFRQREVLDRVEAACKDALSLPEGVTAPITQEAAFHELLRGASVYEAAGTTLAPFKLERVSLPESVHDCPQVADLLPGHARQYLEVPERMLRQDVESVCDVEPYWDPALRSSTKQYKGLIEKLHSIGYLNFTLRPRARAGMFFVQKSDGVRQRLIIDARRANSFLAQPPPVRLCTPEAFARFEFNYGSDDLSKAMPGIVGDGAALFVGLSDIKDAFHRLRQPRWMQELFCLDPIPAQWVGVQGQQIDGVTLAADQLIFPMPASLPMGCSWSLFFAQAVSEHLMSDVPLLAQSALLRDRGPPLVIRSCGQDNACGKKTELPAGDPRHYVYVDNLGVLSTSQELVKGALDEIKSKFEARGLVLHPGEIECEHIDALGCRLSGTKRRASLKPARLWRLRQGIRYLLNLRSVSGRVVEVVLGHCTYCALLNRSLMSVFSSTYKFVRKSYDTRCPLWSSVRQELRTFLGLLPLCFADWAREWNTLVSASDASLSGFGVCTSLLPQNVVGSIGRVPERERFRRGPTLGARATALIQSDLDDDEEADCARLVEAGWEIDLDFPEVPRQLLRKDCWDVKLHGRWQHPDGILVLEAHALLKSLSRIAHTRRGQNVRQLFLVDNMAVALAFDRGRSRNFSMLRIIRKFGALCLVRNISPSVRWIPSEYNAADAPSRIAEGATLGPTSRAQASACEEATAHTRGTSGGDDCEGNRAKATENPGAHRPVNPVGVPSPGRGAPARERHSPGSLTSTGNQCPRHVLERDRGAPGSFSGARSLKDHDAAEKEATSEVPGRSVCERPAGLHLSRVRGGHFEGAAVLPQGAGSVQPLRGTLRAGQRGHGRDRHFLSQSPVLGGTAASQRREVFGRAHARAARLRQTRDLQASQKLAGPQRLATVVPGTVSEADASLRVERSGRGDEEGWPDSHGHLSAPLPVNVQSTLRTSPVHYEVFGATKYGGPERVGNLAGRSGVRDPYQDRRLRPLSGAGLSMAPAVDPSFSGGAQTAAGYGATLGLPVRRVPRDLPASLAAAGSGPVSVPNETFRPQYRPGEKLAESVRRAEEGQLEGLQVCTEIREGWPAIVELPESPPQPSGVCRSVRALSRGCAPQSSASTARALRNRRPGSYFLDLFAGEAGVSRCLRYLGYKSFEYDVMHGPRYDLTLPQVQSRILHAIRTAAVLGVMIALPCHSFSGARDRTSAIRSRDFPWGLPDNLLTQADREKVTMGNLCARATLKFIQACDTRRIPWIVENPHSSKLWTLPEFELLASASHTQVRIVELLCLRHALAQAHSPPVWQHRPV